MPEAYHIHRQFENSADAPHLTAAQCIYPFPDRTRPDILKRGPTGTEDGKAYSATGNHGAVMQIEGKKLRFSNTLWVQHGGVKVKSEGDAVLVEAVDEESYLKVFNYFGRVLKLYTFEADSNQWIDSATGAAPRELDESQAGRVPPPKETAKETPGKSPARPKKTAPKAKSAGAKKTTKAKSAGAKKTTKAKSAGKKRKTG